MQASGLGLEVRPLEDLPLPLDVTIDGADEIFLSPSSISQPGHQRAILIKGRGGALLREKLVETNSKFFVCVSAFPASCSRGALRLPRAALQTFSSPSGGWLEVAAAAQVADESKVVNPETFGTTGAVPVEVTPFAAKVTLRSILREAAASFARAKAKAGADWREGEEGKLAAESAIEKNANKFGIRAEFRGATAAEGESGEARRFQTDNGNFIVDLYFEKPIPDALDLHTRLAEVSCC